MPAAESSAQQAGGWDAVAATQVAGDQPAAAIGGHAPAVVHITLILNFTAARFS
jgi:hypothetical protein